MPPQATLLVKQKLLEIKLFEKINHDESSFHANEEQTWQRVEKRSQFCILKVKMLRDFIEKHGWYLWYSPEEHELAKLPVLFVPDLPTRAHVVFKFGDGYWNSGSKLKW